MTGIYTAKPRVLDDGEGGPIALNDDGTVRMGSIGAGEWQELQTISEAGSNINGLTAEIGSATSFIFAVITDNATFTAYPEYSDFAGDWHAITVHEVGATTPSYTITSPGLFQADNAMLVSGIRLRVASISSTVGDQAPLLFAVGIPLYIAGGGGGGSTLSTGPAGVEYNLTPPTIPDGGVGTAQADVHGNTKVVEQEIPLAEDNTNGVIAQLPKPLVSNTYNRLDYVAFGTVTNAQIKSGASQLYSFHLSSVEASTLYYFQLFNATSATGAPFLSIPITVATATAPQIITLGADFFGVAGKYLATGLSWGVSSTKATYTAAGTAANYQLHVRYF